MLTVWPIKILVFFYRQLFMITFDSQNMITKHIDYCIIYFLTWKLYQLLVTGRWFSPGNPVSSTNKTDRHDIAEILLKVALDTISPSWTNDLVFLHIKIMMHQTYYILTRKYILSLYHMQLKPSYGLRKQQKSQMVYR